MFTNPAKVNLKHARNTSPETLALIGLAQTYMANPILFKGFPKSLAGYFRKEPTETEMADIIYYYSFYALTNPETDIGKYFEPLKFLKDVAAQEMEEDFDEPRLSQLLSRRAILKSRIIVDEFAKTDDYVDVILKIRTEMREDALRARALAKRYHEPHLLALSALALTILARKERDFENAFKHKRGREDLC
ncbi:MAG: hypothetical protein MZW92_17085 [Comamonadaceae bacterium]|nr:hypothetical protein [Comamonadaceae bacterium]